MAIVCNCKGTGRLTNRGGVIASLEPWEPREITAKKMSEFDVYIVKPGQVCPCPCQRRRG